MRIEILEKLLNDLYELKDNNWNELSEYHKQELQNAIEKYQLLIRLKRSLPGWK